MKKLFTTILILATLTATKSQAQDESANPLDTLTSSVVGIRQELDVLKRIKISGYIQTISRC